MNAALLEIWAKSPRPGARLGESLTAHTAAVIARLENLYSLLPGLADRISAPRLWHRAFWACAAHDLGKIASGFQAQLRPGGKPWKQRHEVLSLAFLEWMLGSSEREDLGWVAAGVASHHRDAGEIRTLYPPPDDPEDDPVAGLVADVPDSSITTLAMWISSKLLGRAAELHMAGVEARGLLPPDPVADFRERAATRIHQALLVYARLVRRLAQQPAASRDNLEALALRGLVLMSDHTASAHLRPTTLPLRDPESVVRQMGLGSLGECYPHQQKAAAAVGQAVLTAPTGGGKTEAAFLWVARQMASARPCGRIYYVLPYPERDAREAFTAFPRRRGAAAFSFAAGLVSQPATQDIQSGGRRKDGAARACAREAAMSSTPGSHSLPASEGRVSP